MQRYSTLGLLVVTLTTASAMAWAATTAQNDALAATQVPVSLTQAISTAERHAQGRAIKADFEHGKQGAHYEVEVVSGAKVFDVRVDAEKGTVLSSKEDRID